LKTGDVDSHPIVPELCLQADFIVVDRFRAVRQHRIRRYSSLVESAASKTLCIKGVQHGILAQTELRRDFVVLPLRSDGCRQNDYVLQFGAARLVCR